MSKSIPSRRRRKGIFYEYNGDGQHQKDRIKGWVKRYWSRWRRRQEVLVKKTPNRDNLE